ncbi:MAG: PaaI family thioesterase [Solibacillus sp.]
MTLEQVRESLNQSTFSNLVGFEIDRFEEGDVKLKLKVTEGLLNSNGSLHGGVHATMLDVVLGLTIRSLTKTQCTTITLNLNYLNPLTSDEVIATGKILRQGYKNATAEGELHDSNGILLAKATGTYKLIRDDKSMR